MTIFSLGFSVHYDIIKASCAVLLEFGERVAEMETVGVFVQKRYCIRFESQGLVRGGCGGRSVVTAALAELPPARLLNRRLVGQPQEAGSRCRHEAA